MKPWGLEKEKSAALWGYQGTASSSPKVLELLLWVRGQGPWESQARLPRASKSWEKEQKGSTAPCHFSHGYCLLTQVLQGRTSKVFGPLPVYYVTKDSCFLPVIRRLIINVISCVFLSFEHYLCPFQRKILLIYFISPWQNLVWFVRDLQPVHFLALYFRMCSQRT